MAKYVTFTSPKWHIIVAINVPIWYNMLMEVMP